MTCTEIFIVAQREHEVKISDFLQDYRCLDTTIIIDIVIIGDDRLNNGSADYLRAVSDRIRGDFICLHTDFISQYNLGTLSTMHKLSCSDITMLLTIASKDLKLEEADEELIGICDDGRIILKLLKLEVADSLLLPKALLHHAPTLSLRQDLIDIGIYFMSHWIIKFLMDETNKMSSIKRDLLPYLIQRQFLSSNYINKMIPSIQQHRHRSLQGIESWIINSSISSATSSSSGGSSYVSDDDHFIYDKNILLYDNLFINHIRQHDDDNKSNSKSSGDSDMLRCYGMIYDHIQYSNKANFSINSNDDNISVSNNSIITSMSTMSSSNNAMVTNHSFQSVSSIMLSRLFSIQIYLQMNRLAMMYVYVYNDDTNDDYDDVYGNDYDECDV